MHQKLSSFKPSVLLVFDIETIPDVAGLRRLYHWQDEFSDEEIILWYQQKKRSEYGDKFAPICLQKVVAIACCFRWPDGSQEDISIKNIGKINDEEPHLLQYFFNIFEKYDLQLVSWNGNGFALPVLQHRALIHGIQAPSYWELGEKKPEFKWTNYFSRYHLKHCDLMDVLSKHQYSSRSPLDDMARLCGFPGKLGNNSQDVWQLYYNGDLAKIRSCCETDVLNTYLLFIRFQLNQGKVSRQRYEEEIQRVKDYLYQQKKPHWEEFLQTWKSII